jgi:hypothetical protein
LAQEFWDEQNKTQSKQIQEEMERVIDVLDQNGVDFVVEGNKILIKCDVVYVDLDARVPRGYTKSPPSEEIVISQGGKKVYISTDFISDVSIASGNVAVFLHDHIHIEYKDSHLIIEF